jgi:hypothetical protein
VRLSAHAEVEQDRRGYDRHFRDADIEPDASAFEITDDAARSIEPERAPAGKHDGVHSLDGVHRSEKRYLSSSWRRATDVNAGDGAGFGENDGTARGSFGKRVVSYSNTIDESQPRAFRSSECNNQS